MFEKWVHRAGELSKLIVFAVLAALFSVGCVVLWIQLNKARHANAEKIRELEESGSRLATHAANAEQKVKALSQSSGAGVIVLDNKGVVVHANSTAERILNSGPDGLKGHALIQATLSSEMQDFVINAAKAGKPLTQDFELPGSAHRVMRASVYPLAVGLSGLPETMLILVDISELRRLETIRRDFVANVSHELRTPLASIRAMAETLYEGAREDEEVADAFLQTIIREADRLGRISHDLLILSDAESKAPNREKFDLGTLIRDVVNRSTKHAEQSGITITASAAPELKIEASRDQIEQVLVNLVDNAIKYTSVGGTVHVEGSVEDDHIVVSVADTGIGIMHQDLPRIFERFYRVDKARSRESGGTGLGLSIVKNIVEAHGGSVKVESEFNRGSTFTVYLPDQKDPDVVNPLAV